MSTTDRFHDDIITEILTKVPANSLVQQTKYVYPSILLTTFSMLKTQLYSSSINSSCDESNVEEIENPFKETELVTEVLGSCNGLICLYMDHNSLCLLNPCTREHMFVDLGKNLHVDCCAAYGFGYDSVVGEYKLVHVDRTEYFDDGYDSQVNVYSLSLNDDCKATCLMSFDVPYKIISGDISGIYLNGALHWVAVHEDNEETETIVSFDMREKSFRELLSPNQFRGKTTMEVGMLRGSQLCMLCYFARGDIEVWVMKEYGVMDSWTRQFSFEETVLPSVCKLRSLSLEKHVEIYYRVTPLYFFESGEILIKDGMDLVFYDPKQRTTRKLSILGMPKKPLPKIVTYIPSLVPLKSTTNV